RDPDEGRRARRSRRAVHARDLTAAGRTDAHLRAETIYPMGMLPRRFCLGGGGGHGTTKYRREWAGGCDYGAGGPKGRKDADHGPSRVGHRGPRHGIRGVLRVPAEGAGPGAATPRVRGRSTEGFELQLSGASTPEGHRAMVRGGEGCVPARARPVSSRDG